MLRKPPAPDSPEYDCAAKELAETVKAMADVKVVRHHRPASSPDIPAHPSVHGRTSVGRFRAIAIAASTGGPPALARLLGALPAAFPVPILIVQHMPSGFVDGFTSWLDSNVSVQVKIAEAGEWLLPGVVYVAPHEKHLGVRRGGRVFLSDDPPLDGFRPAATYLFQSAAETLGRHVIAVMLTGMGCDGVAGLRPVREAGGVVVAQDERSCVVFGMPGAAVEADLVDTILPIDRIARYVSDLVAGGTDRGIKHNSS
jgi:two-component system chemotaxis response regulator CheB